MKQFWDARYELEEFVYGESPNDFFKTFIDNVSKTGKILLTAEGEGRNATYAALKNWEVEAFDYSESGQQKALQLAQKHNVTFNYQVQSIEDLLKNYEPEQFDVIGLIYNHFPPNMREPFHKALPVLLKKGGKIVLEVFNQQQLGNPSGGPKMLEMLYSAKMLAQDFEGMAFEVLENAKITLSEGRFHSGVANVVRMVAVK